MPIYSAEHIHNGINFLPSNSAIAADASGIITQVYIGNKPNNCIHLSGVLCPGFINTHCHLELSYLHNKIPKHTGLIGFLETINKLLYATNKNPQVISEAIQTADAQMVANGIVAVGDISNTADSLEQKKQNNLQYHTFVEVLGLQSKNASERIQNGIVLLEKFKAHLSASIAPHAPYSVSETLFIKIAELLEGQITTIHNQECVAENEWIQNAKGPFQQFLSTYIHPKEQVLAKQQNSIAYFAPYLAKSETLFLVHNTFTNQQDVRDAIQYFKNPVWVLCPNANKYIENTLPEIIPFLVEIDAPITLGTDSLASNTKLCIYAEMLSLHSRFPEIGAEKLLQFACSNGAKALNMQQLGTFELGKKPGFVNICNWNSREHMPESPEIVVL